MSVTNFEYETKSHEVTIKPALRQDEVGVLRDTDIDFSLLDQSDDKSVIDFGESVGLITFDGQHLLHDYFQTFADTVAAIRDCEIAPNTTHTGYDDC